MQVISPDTLEKYLTEPLSFNSIIDIYAVLVLVEKEEIQTNTWNLTIFIHKWPKRKQPCLQVG